MVCWCGILVLGFLLSTAAPTAENAHYYIPFDDEYSVVTRDMVCSGLSGGISGGVFTKVRK